MVQVKKCIQEVFIRSLMLMCCGINAIKLSSKLLNFFTVSIHLDLMGTWCSKMCLNSNNYQYDVCV